MTDPAYGTPEWQAERRTYLGASDIPMVVGVSPYGGPLDLARVKLGLDVVEETHAMRRGHIYEPAIAAEYAVLHPEHRMEEVGTFRMRGAPWLRARPDRLITTRFAKGVWEAKNVTPHLMDHYGESGSDMVPDDKYVQVQTQMHVCDLSFAVLVVNFGFETREYTIERDRETGEMLQEAAHEFWHNHVLAKVLPDPTPLVDSMPAIQRTYTLHSSNLVTATAETGALVSEYGEVVATLKRLKERKEMLYALLSKAIGKDYGLSLPSGERVIWPEVKGQESFDKDALIRDLNIPDDVLDKYRSRGNPYRAMKWYGPKKPKAKKSK